MAIDRLHNLILRFAFETRHKRSKGFAIIFVLAFIATIITIIGDLLYQTQIIAKNTMNEESQAQAKGTALTGLSIGKMLVKFHMMATDPTLNKLPITLPNKLYSILNSMPIGRELSKNKLMNELVEPKLLSTLKDISGNFILNIESENCKLNLNLLQPGPFSISAHDALQNLFSTPDSQKMLQLYHTNQGELTNNLEQYLKKVKRSFISLEELRFVEGFQYDDIYNMYTPYFTVWPTLDLIKSPPLNINCAPVELLAAILRPSPQDMINPVLWQKFEKYREDNKFKEISDLNQWFTTNAQTWMNEKVKTMITKFFNVRDNVFLIESQAHVNKTETKITVIIRADEQGKFITDYSSWSR